MTIEGMMSLMRPMSAEEAEKCDWKLFLDGSDEPTTFREFRLVHGYGTLICAMGPAGYPQWAWFENGGGGSITIPFCSYDAHLLIGVCDEPRKFLGPDPTYPNAPRGFLDPKKPETHDEAAVREVQEELGVSLEMAERSFELEGHGQSMNSTFLVAGHKLGVRFYGLEIMRNELELRDGKLMIRSDLVATPHGVEARIMKSRFISWRQAVQQKCGMTSAGVARLIAHVMPSVL